MRAAAKSICRYISVGLLITLLLILILTLQVALIYAQTHTHQKQETNPDSESNISQTQTQDNDKWKDPYYGSNPGSKWNLQQPDDPELNPVQPRGLPKEWDQYSEFFSLRNKHKKLARNTNMIGQNVWYGQNWNHKHPLFPDHDCVRIKHPLIDWQKLQSIFRFGCEPTKLTHTLFCSTMVVNWVDGLQFLGDYRDYPIDDANFETFEYKLKQQCPLGYMTLLILRMLQCVAMMDGSCYSEYQIKVRDLLLRTDYTVFMGSKWPIFGLLNSLDWKWPGIVDYKGKPLNFNCDGLQGNWWDNDLLDWTSFQSLFYRDEGEIDPKTNSEYSWWLDSIHYTYHPKLSSSMFTASKQCLYGVYWSNIIKALWSADSESSPFKIYSEYITHMFFESLHYLGGTKWPLFSLLEHGRTLKRHGFELDFYEEELDLIYKNSGPWLQSLDEKQHMEYLDIFVQKWRPKFGNIVRLFQKAQRQRLMYVTMVYGDKYRLYIKGWLKRAKLLGIENLVLFCLDVDTFNLCQKLGGNCVQGDHISWLNKYTLLLVALQLGIDVMWLDFDIFLVKDPTDYLLRLVRGKEYFLWKGQQWENEKMEKLLEKHSPFVSFPQSKKRWYVPELDENQKEEIEPYELLIGYTFTSDCICNGFFYLKATPTTTNWLKQVLIWLYNHPYEHDQRLMGAFLNYTEKVSFPRPKEASVSVDRQDADSTNSHTNENSNLDWRPPEIPHWSVLDANNLFVHWPEWSGNLEDMVLIHFVDGAAYSLYGRGDWDASIPEARFVDQAEQSWQTSVSKAQNNSKYGKQKEEQSSTSSKSKSMLDVFYLEGEEQETREDVWSWAWQKQQQDGDKHDKHDKHTNEYKYEISRLQKLVLSTREDSIISYEDRQMCGILPNVKSAHEGRGWIGKRNFQGT